MCSFYFKFDVIKEMVVDPSVRCLMGICAGLQFENNCEVGVFSKLTNAFCLVAIGGSESFYR